MKRPRTLPLLFALIVAAACSGPRETALDTSAVQIARDSIADTAAPVGSGCRLSGDWQECSVVDRLNRAGLVLTKLNEGAWVDFFGLPALGFKVGGGDDRVELFLWPSEDARRNALAAVDSATVSPAGGRRSYRVPPLLVTSRNLAAVIFTDNPRTSERLSLALSAGLPPTPH